MGKHILFISLLTIGLTFSGCSSGGEENPPSSSNSNLVSDALDSDISTVDSNETFEPTCGDNEELVNGECQTKEIQDPTCGDNEELVNGECQTKEIQDPTCGDNEELVNGECQTKQAEEPEPTCGDNEELVNGECQTKQIQEPEPINSNPIITISTAIQVVENGSIEIPFTYSDSDGDSVGAEIVTQPEHGSASTGLDYIQYNSEQGYIGGDSFKVKFSDGNGGEVEKSIGVTVVEANTTKELKNFDYWGWWTNVENQSDKIYITSKDALEIEIPEDSTGDNFIHITDQGYYLRSGERYLNVKGSLYSENYRAMHSSLYSSIGGIEVILKNILDENIEAKATISEDDKFEVASLPAGEYIISAESDEGVIETEVTLERDLQDLGSFKLVPENLANFKSELILNGSGVIYANGEEQSGTLRVRNISSIDEEVLITPSIDGVSFSTDSNRANDLEIESGDYDEVTVKFTPLKTQVENLIYLDLDVELSSGTHQWSETLKIPVHKGDFNLTIKTKTEGGVDSTRNIAGVLISPSGQSTYIDTREETLTLPLISPDESYIFRAVSGGEYSTYYGVGLNSYTFDFLNHTELSPTDQFNISLNSSEIEYLGKGKTHTWTIFTPNDLNKTAEDIHNQSPKPDLDITGGDRSDEALTLSAEDSTDDGSIVSYRFESSIDGTLCEGSESVCKKDSLSEGTHTITLTVTDNLGVSSHINFKNCFSSRLIYLCLGR